MSLCCSVTQPKEAVSETNQWNGDYVLVYFRCRRDGDFFNSERRVGVIVRHGSQRWLFVNPIGCNGFVSVDTYEIFSENALALLRRPQQFESIPFPIKRH